METIYYSLNAARITAGGDRKASGGEGVRCVVLPRTARPGSAGKVLDFAACRQALEAREAPGPEPAANQARAVSAAPRAARRGRGWAAADLCASVAIVACTAVAALGVLLT